MSKILSDLYVRRIANLLIKQHGKDATSIVAQVPDELFANNVADAAEIRSEIIENIEKVLHAPPL